MANETGKSATEEGRGPLQRARRALVHSPLRAAWRRRVANPFADGGQHLIVHTAHHKAGTSWFNRVLRALSVEYGIPFVHGDARQIRPGRSAFFFQNRRLFDPADFGPYRGSHMRRDPRDMVISGYHYHLWCKEPWAVKKIRDLPKLREQWSLLPIADLMDMSYQEYLNSLDLEAGMMAEIHRCATTVIAHLADWDYDDPASFEFRYEDIISDEDAVFRRMFEHYGFHERAVERSVDIARQFSFQKRTGRELGDAQDNSHIRSGKLAQWTQEFSPAHKARFKELHGDTLIQLGYEQDLNW